jgi:hypothetical protein
MSIYSSFDIRLPVRSRFGEGRDFACLPVGRNFVFRIFGIKDWGVVKR